jgi:hypothetical protein
MMENRVTLNPTDLDDFDKVKAALLLIEFISVCEEQISNYLTRCGTKYWILMCLYIVLLMLESDVVRYLFICCSDILCW